MNVLFLAAGGDVIDTHDRGYPLCLTELDGVPLLQRQVEQCARLDEVRMIFAIREEDAKQWHLDNVVRLLAPEAGLVRVRNGTAGAACTALLAAELIADDRPLLILNANEWITADFRAAINDFSARQLDAGVITFPSIHARYSYVRLDDEGLVVEAAEKNPISRNATAGFYWYARGGDFMRAAQRMILKDAHVDGAFYICPVFNELVLQQMRIGTYRIDVHDYHPLKSERQLQQLETLMSQPRGQR